MEVATAAKTRSRERVSSARRPQPRNICRYRLRCPKHTGPERRTAGLARPARASLSTTSSKGGLNETGRRRVSEVRTPGAHLPRLEQEGLDQLLITHVRSPHGRTSLCGRPRWARPHQSMDKEGRRLAQ